MSFSLEPKCVPKGADEQEIFNVLNRNVHGDDLEDDFFQLAEGAGGDCETDSDSTIEAVDDTAGSSERSDQEGPEHDYYSLPYQQASTQSPAPQSKPDTLASLIDQLNAHSREQFNQLSALTERRAKARAKKPKKPVDYTECNMILNRLGALYHHTAEVATEVAEVTAGDRLRANKPRKSNSRRPSGCGNWEDVAGTSKHRPNII